MQHYTRTEREYLRKYIAEKYPEDLSVMKHYVTHSDNASHFKSTGAMHFYTTLMEEEGGASKASYVYHFGAPHHGKCWNDGISGGYNNTTDRDGASSETRGMLVYTSTGYIENVRDVYLSLVHNFERGEHRDRRSRGTNPISAHRFFVMNRTATQCHDLRSPTQH